jgi:hypothetical protein
MQLPQKKKPGDPIMAEDWNLLLDAIAARTPRPGDGLKLIASSGGFAYSKPGQKFNLPGQPPFSVIAIEKSGSKYKVTIKEGWVIDRLPKTTLHPAVVFRMPTASGTPLNATPRPQIEMSIGDYLWCQIKTTIEGLISETPLIVVDSTELEGVHYYPKDPEDTTSGGSEGNYYVKLFKLALEDGSPKVIPYQQSDIEHWAQLWTGENIGEGSRVFKQHDEENNIYQFRSLVGIEPVKVEEKEGSIEFSLDGKDMDITIVDWSVDNSGHIYQLSGNYDYDILCVRRGLVVGIFKAAALPALTDPLVPAETTTIARLGWAE